MSAEALKNLVTQIATIIDSHTLKCSSPPLTRSESLMKPEDMVHTFEVTMTGGTWALSPTGFAYYPSPDITGVIDSNKGPVSGGTHHTIKGRGFTHPNICDLRLRYGALEVIPSVLNGTALSSVSPQVNVPDAVVIVPSGNGQNYGADLTLHYRDPENTFTYYQDVFVHSLHP